MIIYAKSRREDETPKEFLTTIRLEQVEEDDGTVYLIKMIKTDLGSDRKTEWLLGWSNHRDKAVEFAVNVPFVGGRDQVPLQKF